MKSVVTCHYCNVFMFNSWSSIAVHNIPDYWGLFNIILAHTHLAPHIPATAYRSWTFLSSLLQVSGSSIVGLYRCYRKHDDSSIAFNARHTYNYSDVDILLANLHKFICRTISSFLQDIAGQHITYLPTCINVYAGRSPYFRRTSNSTGKVIRWQRKRRLKNAEH